MKDHRQATVGTTLFSVASGQNRLISLTVVRLRRLTQSVTRVLTLNGRISEYVLFAALLVLLTAIVVVVYYLNRPLPEVAPDTGTYLELTNKIQTQRQLVDPARVPGFPLLMVFVFALTWQNNLMAVSIAHGVLFVLAALEIYIIALLIFRRGWTAFLVGLLVGANVTLLAFVKPILSEALSLWLLVSLALVAVLFVYTLRIRYLWLTAGFTLALFFTRVEYIYVPVPLFAYLLLVAARRGGARRMLVHVVACVLLLYAILGGYIYINATQYHYAGVTATQNINFWGKVLNYNMQDEAPPEYAYVTQIVHTYQAQGISDPQQILYNDPLLSRDYYALAGAYARTIVLHHPVEFASKSVSLALWSLTSFSWDDGFHVDPAGQFGTPLTWLESVFVTLYDWNRFFPVCAALWLFLLCWRRTAHLLAIQAMGMIALLVLYGLVLSAVGGIQDYTRLQVPFRPLLILIICGSLLLGFLYGVHIVVHEGLAAIWRKLDEAMRAGRESTAPAQDRSAVSVDWHSSTPAAQRPACITRDGAARADADKAPVALMRNALIRRIPLGKRTATRED